MSFFFFFNDTATTEIYTLSLHDALPICESDGQKCATGTELRHRSEAKEFIMHSDSVNTNRADFEHFWPHFYDEALRSEEHTSELQSRSDLVCRLLLEKKKKNRITTPRASCTTTTILLSIPYTIVINADHYFTTYFSWSMYALL